MKSYDKIVEGLDSHLEFLESETEDVLTKAEEGIKIAKKALLQLRKVVINKELKSREQEITIFKIIKPKIYSRLIYYVKLFSIESKRPRGSSKSQKKYLDYEIKKLQDYFNDNLEFYQYYRRSETSLDNQYFIRGKEDIRLHPDNFHFFIDDKFSTSHDSTVATIIAYDMLIVYLQKEIELIENRNGMETNFNAFQKQSKLFWTGNKTDLIELIYALQSSGVINSGTADIKEVASICEQMFNISLGDYYRTFLEIRSRKINQTKFIDKLKDSLASKMLESDE
ncbi:MAG: RteC domain-containing protein [Xanthomarina gelatinilytica]|uniref:RteC domain-containing protein n=1 Tax=Xanthomarina gelatinilytica TaxID=1137281 RepID=UPI003A859B05